MTNLDLGFDGNLTVGHMFCRQVLYHYAYQLPAKLHQARLCTQGFCLDCLYCLYVGIDTHISGISL